MIAEPMVYEILLRVGQHIHNLQDDVKDIWDSFVLPSWLSAIYEVRIPTRVSEDHKPSYFQVWVTPNRLDQQHIVELFFFDTRNDQQHIIDYFVQDAPPPSMLKNKITVSFHKDVQNGNLRIRVRDEECFLRRILAAPEDEKYLQIRRQPKQGELQYPYIQPEDIRAKEERTSKRFSNLEKHFHLAFQGGGSKGIAYMGAYKALRDLNPDCEITSVIGSSAGSMISLGIAAGGSFEELFSVCNNMQKIPFDRTIKSVDDLTPQKLGLYVQIRKRIQRAFHDYGLVCREVFDLLVDEVLVEDIIQKLFEILSAQNESIGEMLKLEVENEVIQHTCCSSMVIGHERQVRLLSYYGLLEGRLLLGKELQNISLAILKSFLERTYLNRREQFVKVLGLTSPLESQGLISIAQRLTMKTFYQLSGVEFTATSVDLDSQLLRFFNHKTTPDLPVSKAVLMSGSFPIAFETVSWRKEWGRYYVHYSNRRREIDLTDHKFTDGGMLANFPIMFLDNEEMRPMYFSHRPNHLTKLFGFGLEQINEDLPFEAKAQLNEKMERLRRQLSEIVSKRLPKLKLLYYQLKYVPKPQTVPASELIALQEVPIIGFLFKLLDTYVYANDNLVIECFQRNIYFLPVHFSMVEALKPVSESETQLNLLLLKQSLINFYNSIAARPRGMMNLVTTLKEGVAILEAARVTNKDIIGIKNWLRQTLLDLGMYHSDRIGSLRDQQSNELLGSLKKMSHTFSQMLERLRLVCRTEVVDYCDTVCRDSTNLKSICSQVLALFSFQSVSGELQSLLTQHFNRYDEHIREKQLSSVKTTISTIAKKMLKSRPSIKPQSIEEDDSQKMDINDSELVRLLSVFYHATPLKGHHEQFDQCRRRIIELGSLFLKQQLVFDAERRKMGTYIEDMLRRRRSNNIHLVFQSVGEYNKTAFEIYKLVNEYVFLEENTKAEYHSERIADMILLNASEKQAESADPAVDLTKRVELKCELLAYISENLSRLWEIAEIKLEQGTLHITEPIRQQILAITNSVNRESCKVTSVTCSSMHCYFGFLLMTGFKLERIERQLQSMKTSFEIDVKHIKEEFDRKDWILPFKCKIRELQSILWDTRYNLFGELEKAARENRLTASLETIRREFEDSKDTIMNSYSDILEFLMATEAKANHEKSFPQYLASRMALKVGERNYYKDNQKISEDTKQLVNLLLAHFYEQLRFLVSSFAPDTMREFLGQEHDSEKQEALWKGMVISRFLNCDRFKKRLQEILKEMNLPKDIRLKDFHEVVPRKLELTFTAVDITNKKIVLINHHTFPEMPVWAAVITGSSFPILFPEVRSSSHWVERIQAKSEERYLKQFFSDGQYKRPPIFTSGNLLSSLPLELLTNRKMRQSCFAGKQYTFLSFGTVRERKQGAVMKQFHRKFMTLSQLLSVGLSKLTNAMFGVKDLIELNSGVVTKGSFVETYMMSHDNLILELYSDSVLRLPVRLGTMEFYKLGKKVQGQDLTVSDKTIDETYYCTKEKFTGTRVTYIEIRLFQGTLRLRFLSKQRSNRDMKSNYKIQYKVSEGWEPLRNQEIFVKFGTPSIGLKFYYVDQRNKDEPYRPLLVSSSQTISIQESQYQLDLSKFASVYSQYCGVFEFPYTKVFNARLKLVGPPSKSLLRNIQRRVSVDHIFNCRTVVQLFRTGLYCERCCSSLRLLKQGQNRLFEEICSKCENKRLIRFECSREYQGQEECSNRYCFKCSKNQSVLRTQNHLMCFNHHEFVYVHRKLLKMRVGITAVRCDLCLGFCESYFSDDKCDIRICQTCCAEFAVD